MHRNLSTALNLLHPDVNVTISLQGFMISCFDETGRFKIGIPECKDHQLNIDIFCVPRSVCSSDKKVLPPVERIRYPVKRFSIEEVPQPGELAGRGVTSYKHFESSFSRTSRSPSPAELKDFRWIVDLNGEEFHNRELVPRGINAVTGTTGIPTVISVNSGTVYTQAVSSETLFRRDEEGRLALLGRIAYRTGIDITSSSLKGTVEGLNCSGNTFEWNKDENWFHLIQITHTCHLQPDVGRPEKTAGKSDFDLFYDYLVDPVINHRKYDLQSCIDSADDPDPRLDGYPDICIVGYLGGSDIFRGGGN